MPLDELSLWIGGVFLLRNLILLVFAIRKAREKGDDK